MPQSIHLSVSPGPPRQRHGQATTAVQTADPSAHGLRSAMIGGAHNVSPRYNLLNMSFGIKRPLCLCTLEKTYRSKFFYHVDW